MQSDHYWELVTYYEPQYNIEELFYMPNSEVGCSTWDSFKGKNYIQVLREATEASNMRRKRRTK